MTALGVNVSSRDSQTWHDQRPSHRAKSRELIDAIEEREAAWKQLNEMTDSLIAVGNYERLQELADEALLAEQRVIRLRHQETCQHQRVMRTGNIFSGRGDVYDTIEDVCLECGAKV